MTREQIARKLKVLVTKSLPEIDDCVSVVNHLNRYKIACGIERVQGPKNELYRVWRSSLEDELPIIKNNRNGIVPEQNRIIQSKGPNPFDLLITWSDGKLLNNYIQ